MTDTRTDAPSLDRQVRYILFHHALDHGYQHDQAMAIAEDVNTTGLITADGQPDHPAIIGHLISLGPMPIDLSTAAVLSRVHQSIALAEGALTGDDTAAMTLLPASLFGSQELIRAQTEVIVQLLHAHRPGLELQELANLRQHFTRLYLASEGDE